MQSIKLIAICYNRQSHSNFMKPVDAYIFQETDGLFILLDKTKSELKRSNIDFSSGSYFFNQEDELVYQCRSVINMKNSNTPLIEAAVCDDTVDTILLRFMLNPTTTKSKEEN